MKIALCQPAVTENKIHNIANARKLLESAAKGGADIAILPEMFCINYVPEQFLAASESVPDGESCKMLEDAARTLKMTVIGGSVPELYDGKIYNTSVVFSDKGTLLGFYRKAHLFDVDIDGFRFMESDTVNKGDGRPLVIDSPIKTGISICFDIRFPEWSRIMMNAGVDLIALPAAFSVKTGPKHWELLLRARALDNQCFVAGVAPASSKCSYGHSMICSPDGEVMCDLGTEENMKVVELPMDELERMRNSIPIRTARRTDLY